MVQWSKRRRGRIDVGSGVNGRGKEWSEDWEWNAVEGKEGAGGRKEGGN